MRTWNINEPVASATHYEAVPTSDKTDGDVDANSGKPTPRGLLRRVVWPPSDISALCCAADECYT